MLVVVHAYLVPQQTPPLLPAFVAAHPSRGAADHNMMIKETAAPVFVTLVEARPPCARRPASMVKLVLLVVVVVMAGLVPARAMWPTASYYVDYLVSGHIPYSYEFSCSNCHSSVVFYYLLACYSVLISHMKLIQ